MVAATSSSASLASLAAEMPAMTEREYVLFRDYIETHCSIALGDDKKYLLESRLARIVAESGCGSFTDFYRKASSSTDSALRDKIVDAVTTNETLWFRDGSPWETLRDHLLPALSRRASSGEQRRFRIWSAACSTGQEPYSIAMVVDDFCQHNPASGLSPSMFEILATDISPSAIFIAMSGRYDAVSMRRGLVGEFERFRGTYFEKKGMISELKSDVKQRVTFKRYNLQDDFAPLGQFDLVFLRYVAIYFSPAFKRDLFRRLAQAMQPHASLILGSAETLTEGTNLFDIQRTGKVYYFQKKGTP